MSTVRQELIPLYEWGCTVPVVWYEGKAHYPLTSLCDVLGVKSQQQRDRLREHAVLGRLLRQLPVKTRTGTRETWCIERRGIGFWLGSIQIASIRADIQPRLMEFQEALVDAAESLVVGRGVVGCGRGAVHALPGGADRAPGRGDLRGGVSYETGHLSDSQRRHG